MYRRCLILVLLLALACVGWGPVTVDSLVGAGGTCTLRDSFGSGGDSQSSFGRYNLQERSGGTYTPATDCDVCQVDVYVKAALGTPGTNDYYFEFWTLDGSNNQNALATNGRSDEADTIVNDDWQEFIWTSGYADLAGSTTYGWHIKSIDEDDPANTTPEYDEDNCGTIWYDDENNSTANFGGRWIWQADGTLGSSDAEDDMYIKVYCYQ